MKNTDSSKEVIATLRLTAVGVVVEEGKLDLFTHQDQHETRVHITEAMLLQMNGFIRAKWDSMRAAMRKDA